MAPCKHATDFGGNRIQMVERIFPRLCRHRLRHASFFSAIFLILAGLCAHADAQTFRGTILGTVTDTSGAVIQDATVRARNVATGLERITSTDSDGNYIIAELPIGTYDVSVEKRGFSRRFTVAGVTVAVASEKRVDAALKPPAAKRASKSTPAQSRSRRPTIRLAEPSLLKKSLIYPSTGATSPSCSSSYRAQPATPQERPIHLVHSACSARTAIEAEQTITCSMAPT